MEKIKFILLIATLLFSFQNISSIETIHEKIIEKHYQNGNKFTIIGAGPVGLYLSLRILENIKHSSITLYEPRDFSRPQVARITYESSDIFPDKIKEKMWENPKIRQKIFGEQSSSDKNFWPKPGYQYWTFISLGTFQTYLLDYLLETYKERLVFVKEKGTVENILEITNKDANAVFIATGDAKINKDLRSALKMSSYSINDSETRLEVDKRGLYLIFKIKHDEDFIRENEYLSPKTLSPLGLTYAASNNVLKEVQLYTYPLLNLKEIFENMPESIKPKASFPKFLNFNSDNFLELTPEEKEWFDTYRNEIITLTKNNKIEIPEDNVQVYYADRGEYAYPDVSTLYKELPIIFIGDSMGATDFKFGLNLGRGMEIVDVFIDILTNFGIEIAQREYQMYWDYILRTEFGLNDPNLTNTPWVQFKYIIRGRNVNGNIMSNIDYEKYKRDFDRN